MPYDWNNPWGMDKLECTYLKCFCVDHAVKLAIEFGPGNSTQALLDAEVKVVSLESDHRRSAELKQQYPNVEILEYTGTSFPIVAPWAPLERMFDLAIIDGPPGSTVRPARLNSALFCYPRTKRMIFHDSNRDVETIGVMLDLGMIVLDKFESQRGIVVLSK